jgi:hypothetical protein
MRGFSAERDAEKTDETPVTSIGSPAWKFEHISGWPQLRLDTYLSTCPVALQISRQAHVGNSCVPVGRTYCFCLCSRAGACNSSCPTIAVCRRTSNNSANWIAISDSIFKPFQYDCIDCFGFHVAISFDIKRMTSTRGTVSHSDGSSIHYMLRASSVISRPRMRVWEHTLDTNYLRPRLLSQFLCSEDNGMRGQRRPNFQNMPYRR